MAIDPNVELARFEVPKSGLQLFSRHASQFSQYLVDDYKVCTHCLFTGTCPRMSVYVCVWFSSSWCGLCALVSPYVLNPVCEMFPQHCLWNRSSVGLIDDGPLSAFQGLFSISSFCAPAPGKWRCNVVGFEPAGSILSSSTLQTFWGTSSVKSNQSLLFINIQSIKMKISFDTWAQEGTFKITINIK